ncbi:MAG: UDP-N-acetylmuramate--L-alanine ligase [Legionellaceae bacterium]|nr:UDP-N-acetylmuramate--L-alanine ligase [Legionellaceae bacterium]
MSGLAEVLHYQGYQVSGSDLLVTSVTDRLNALGITVYQGHSAEHIKNADFLVVTSAVTSNNVEVLAARNKKIPVLKRAEMLAELMRMKRGIAIAGTSGKTTTTSLLAAIMHAAKLDPTYIIGGKVNSIGANAKLGSSEFLLAEADESDASFLYLSPEIAVITNINPDHLYNYQQNFSRLKQAFHDFLNRLPINGLAILCADDKNVVEQVSAINRACLTYGFSEKVDFRAVHVKMTQSNTTFAVKRNGKPDLHVELNMLGRHNVLNALAAIAVADYLKIEDQCIVKGLSGFLGVDRRLNICGEKVIAGKKALLIDDYGHHPKELLAAINTLREVWPNRSITMVFQPHRFTRTRDLFDELVDVLTAVDRLILLPIYPACESPIEGISSQTLCQAVKQGEVVSPSDLLAVLKHTLHDDDILLMQGAGDIGLLVEQFI